MYVGQKYLKVNFLKPTKPTTDDNWRKMSGTSEVEHSVRISCTMKFNVHVVFEDYMANLSKNTA